MSQPTNTLTTPTLTNLFNKTVAALLRCYRTPSTSPNRDFYYDCFLRCEKLLKEQYRQETGVYMPGFIVKCYYDIVMLKMGYIC